MNPIAIKYPLDLTGIAPNNLVANEPQTLLNNPNRAFVPNYGPFYVQGLIIIDQATGQPLTPLVQYMPAQLHSDLSEETGQEICQVIVITDPSVSNNILVSYQVVGGEYAYSVDALIQMLAALQIDARAVTYGQILGLPSRFPPTEHLHDIGDTYGWEYMVAALESLRQAILTGDDAARQNMLAYINAAIAQIQAAVTGFNSLLTAHTGNLNNPHQTTPALIGLGNVMNYGIATQADVSAGTSNQLYVTPYALAGLGSATANGLAAHIANHNNPHGTTAALIGLGSVVNAGFGSNTDAITGTSTAVYMNPALTKAAVIAFAYTPLNTALNTHIANVANPHGTTAAQVNLGNVPNVGYATLTEAKAGTGNNFMSGALVGQAIATLALSPLNTHIANNANPHGVTAAQLNLGNVNNTSDINKPISTATQTALNNCATIGSGPRFASVFIGADTDIYLYEYTTNGFAIRTGSTGGGFSYTTLSGGGDLSIGGKMTATKGFGPSDRRLKTEIEDFTARPLWQFFDMKTYLWIKGGTRDNGPIAQDIQAFAPEFIDISNPIGRPDGIDDILAVDHTSMAFEMSVAAGKATDALSDELSKAKSEIEQLKAQFGSLEEKFNLLLQALPPKE